MNDIRIAVEIPEFEGIDLADDIVSDLEGVLSEVAGAVVSHHAAGFGAGAEPLSKTLVDVQVIRIRQRVARATSPQEARRALVDGARRCVALVRLIDAHLAAVGADAPFAPYDMESL